MNGKAGRPPLSEDSETIIFSVKLPEDVKERLKEAGQKSEEYSSGAEILRAALRIVFPSIWYGDERYSILNPETPDWMEFDD